MKKKENPAGSLIIREAIKPIPKRGKALSFPISKCKGFLNHDSLHSSFKKYQKDQYVSIKISEEIYEKPLNQTLSKKFVNYFDFFEEKKEKKEEKAPMKIEQAAKRMFKYFKKIDDK